MEYKLTLDHFGLSITKTDEMLLVEAEDNLSGNVFSKTLNEESAKSLTSDRSLDTDIVFQLLKDFIQNRPEKVSLTLSKEGKLSYACQAMFGTVPREFGFVIQLDKQPIEPIVKIEKMLERLSTRVSELEKEKKVNDESISKKDVEKLLKANDDRYHTLEKLMLEKFEKLEKMLVKVQERVLLLESNGKVVQEIPSVEKEENIQNNVLHYEGRFNPASDFAAKYSLTNGNTTALSKTGQFCTLFADLPLPKGKKTRFVMQVEKEHNLLVGIAPNVAMRDNTWPTSPATLGYRDIDGYIYKENRQFNEKLPTFAKGDKIAFVIDMQNGEVLISLNGKVIYTHIIPREQLSTYQFYPFISTNANSGVGVTFICEFKIS